MINNKFTKIFVAAIIGSLLIYPTNVHAETNKSIKSEETLNTNEGQATNYDLLKISPKIDKVLSSKYEVMKTWEFKSLKDIVKDSKLLELLDKTNNFESKWNKKGNLKIDDYNSKLKIDNAVKTSHNVYIVNATYDVEFNVTGSEATSKSLGEKYRFEVKFQNDDYYITKMVNLNEDYETEAKSSLKESDNTFKDYDNIINSKIKRIDYAYNNMNQCYNNFLEIESNVRNNTEKSNVRNNTEKSNVRNNTEKSNMEYKNAEIARGNTFPGKYEGYNHSAAVKYAERYADTPNPYFLYFKGEDCTNFVSQCAWAAGVPCTYTWSSGTKTWNCVVPFFNYMVSNGYASNPDDGCKHAQLGDILQLYNPASKEWTHSIIATSIDSNGMNYCAHSNNRKNYPVFSVFSAGFSNIRLIKFW